MRHFLVSAALFALSGQAASAKTVSISQADLQKLRNQAQTARDVQEIQNVMSRRAMYHSVGRNELELELWAQKSPVRWAQNQGCWIGMDSLRNYYVTINYAMQKNDLAQRSAANPAIENNFAKNRNIGTNVYHLLTTPIIEVAQDGKTAKGFWYTPGVILSTPDGIKTEAMNMWEKYGVDFIREDGVWRILHVEVLTDFAGPWGEPLPEHQGPPAAAMGKEGDSKLGSGPGPGAQSLQIPGPDIAKKMYSEYSPMRVPVQKPSLPERYSTLSQTFEYADCKGN